MGRTLKVAGVLVAVFLLFVVIPRVECYPPNSPLFYSPEDDVSEAFGSSASSVGMSSHQGKREAGKPIDTATAIDAKRRGDRSGDAEFPEDFDDETMRLLEDAFRTSSDDSEKPEDKSNSRPADEMQLRRYDIKPGIRAGTLVSHNIGDRIIFPENLDIPMPMNNRRGPVCRHGAFCEDTPFYPIEQINRAIRSDTNLKYLQVKDELEPNVSLRTSGQEEVLCESKRAVVLPRAAKNKNDEWRYIINTENFTQAIGVETCEKDDSPCKLVDNFAGGYRTMCKQNYIYRQLLAVGPKNKIALESFPIPASCCCHVQFIGDTILRMGTNLQKSGS
ncbi:uncharacterized protein LOC135163476 [Diachasmimorpha longicaudata]|uniref:uncharacterized protein LOC135163476 n=1 Tax=Diachasmimorpha longicaudata TaxID=58733 RepID=UPI0030B88A45